jgi:hypothetical protein
LEGKRRIVSTLIGVGARTMIKAVIHRHDLCSDAERIEADEPFLHQLWQRGCMKFPDSRIGKNVAAPFHAGGGVKAHQLIQQCAGIIHIALNNDRFATARRTVCSGA